MKSILLLSLLTSVFGGVAHCGGDFQITELKQSPDLYIHAGENLTLTLKYIADVEVTQGTAVTTITYNGIPFAPSTTELNNLPIAIGEHDGSTWSEFPSGVSGKLVSRVEGYDASERKLLCIESTLKAL